MAINALSDEGSQGSFSALDRALVPDLSLGDSKGSIATEASESSDSSSCSASTETVATNLDASNHSQAQTSRPDERPRRVKFSDKARVRKIPHHSSLTEEQIADMWISKEDYKALRKDCAQRIRFLDKVKLKHPNEAPFCTRGLLGHTSAARAKKNAYRDVMYDALAQALEKEMESGLDEALSEICRICSAPSVKTAHMQGLRDARDAKKIHEHDSGMKAVKI
mmetsp:Transcript_29032/g.70115  ORF Transcript_29032/g.70115 Transcript_29032/m.70115 type:complete len:223 (+) Transcript_29032:264-932(+)|eukprot:CAMPEP_0113641050 /NCGR_PEP_ID=MMETSP0017_2-20120614/21549_1 /TAXON_ID=2856 /ORGANISM="Cylindrotheca closterium" /LENGTH=222 /DNA_ID=CAMNT_0000552371 /DNA_START=136 /DNA_END=804 /DNA_ORIENTATION=+ /assembly_acc=CAM_ASM_000147